MKYLVLYFIVYIQVFNQENRIFVGSTFGDYYKTGEKHWTTKRISMYQQADTKKLELWVGNDLIRYIYIALDIVEQEKLKELIEKTISKLNKEPVNSFKFLLDDKIILENSNEKNKSSFEFTVDTEKKIRLLIHKRELEQMRTMLSYH